jgi:hypothetical protein
MDKGEQELRVVESVYSLLRDVRERLNGIAASAAQIAEADVDVADVADDLATGLNGLLLEFEIALAEANRHSFEVKQ